MGVILAVPLVDQFILDPPPQQRVSIGAGSRGSDPQGHKYNVSRLKTKKNEEGKVRHRLIACDQAGKPKNTRQIEDADRKRPMRRSKRSGCPMRVSIVAVDDTNTAGPWRIQHTKDGTKMHNHAASSDVRVHVAHRQRAARQAKVAGMYELVSLLVTHVWSGPSSTGNTLAKLVGLCGSQRGNQASWVAW